MEPRYAIYFVPGADTPLYQFGASVLGYDCYGGCDMPPISGANVRRWADVVREPRVYGFHATLKAPFRLAKGTQERDLAEAVTALAAEQPAVLGGELAVRALGSFIALVPAVPCAELDRLAQACVRELDRFRAPMVAEERARRLAADLTPRQIEYLDRWGYPFVFEDFRFHMTLTGALGPAEYEPALMFLRSKFEQVPAAHTLHLDRIVIACQREKSRPFRVVHEAFLGQSARRPYAYSC